MSSSSSPPLSPLRQYIPSIEPLSHRRPSSSYSHTNRSPITPRSSYSGHRLSNSSRYSNGMPDLSTPLDSQEHDAGAEGGGGGNLADELEFADEDEDEDYWDEGVSALSLADDAQRANGTEHSMKHGPDGHPSLSAETDGARDSGIDVADRAAPSCQNSAPSPLPQGKQQPHRAVLNFSRPISRDGDSDQQQQPPTPTDVFSIEMEDAMNAISRLANPPSQQHADTIPKALSAMQHLYPQSTLETHTQRLTTSTNSLTSHLTQQTRLVASLSTSLFTPFGATTPLNLAAIDDIVPQMMQVLQSLPLPEAGVLQALAKLDRDTTDLLRTLASLTDSLQMGKQTTSSAARHLRNTHTMVTQLRRESDLAEQAKWKIEKEGWERKLGERWCARECSDVVGGFEQVCEGLRRGLEESVAA